MATHTQQAAVSRKPWQHGTRPVNRGHMFELDRNGKLVPTRCSFTGMHYSTYMELHTLAKLLTRGMGRHVTLAQALHHAVANALRDMDEGR